MTELNMSLSSIKQLIMISSIHKTTRRTMTSCQEWLTIKSEIGCSQNSLQKGLGINPGVDHSKSPSERTKTSLWGISHRSLIVLVVSSSWVCIHVLIICPEWTCIVTGGYATNITWTRDAFTVTERNCVRWSSYCRIHLHSVWMYSGSTIFMMVSNSKPSTVSASIAIAGTAHSSVPHWNPIFITNVGALCPTGTV